MQENMRWVGRSKSWPQEAWRESVRVAGPRVLKGRREVEAEGEGPKRCGLFACSLLATWKAMAKRADGSGSLDGGEGWLGAILCDR